MEGKAKAEAVAGKSERMAVANTGRLPHIICTCKLAIDNYVRGEQEAEREAETRLTREKVEKGPDNGKAISTCQGYATFNSIMMKCTIGEQAVTNSTNHLAHG